MHERVVEEAAGTKFVRRERGVPLLWDRDFGQIPLDDEFSLAADGGHFERMMWSRGDGCGFVERGVQVLRVFGDDSRPGLVELAPRPAVFRVGDDSDGPRVPIPQNELSLRLIFVLESPKEARAVPPRKLCGAPMRALFRPDHLGELRQFRLEEWRRLSKATIQAACATIEAVGGTVHRTQAWPFVAVVATVPARALQRLADEPAFLTIEREIEEGAPDGARVRVDSECEVEDMFRKHLDWYHRTTCSDGEDSEGVTKPHPYMDTLHVATGVDQYIDKHYTGAGIDGISDWAEYFQSVTDPDSGDVSGGLVPALGVAVVDSGIDATHPAFQGDYGFPRTHAWILSSGDVAKDVLNTDYRPAVKWTPFSDPSGFNHGTGSSAVVGGSIADGQDVRVDGDKERGARSGIARKVRFLFSHGLATFLSVATDHDLLPDVANVSLNLNSGASPAAADYYAEMCETYPAYCALAALGDPEFGDRCPTRKQARGTDTLSAAVNAAWFDGVLTVKSAGNMHERDPINSVRWCERADPEGSASAEVSTPGAAATIISVGALEVDRQASGYLQRERRLYEYSSEGPTKDGRTYPSLVVPHIQCGCANFDNSDLPKAADGERAGYTDHGATSGASPRVAGAALALKHWMSYRYGTFYAFEPGYLTAMLLNMADGYVATDRDAGAGYDDSPGDGYGLGRVRMRLFDDDHMSAPWYQAVGAWTLSANDAVQIDLGGGADIPRLAQRLRITIWWAEMNTGKGEDKAEVFAEVLADGDPVDIKSSKDGSPLRFEFQCGTAHYESPPNGAVLLILATGDVPTEERGWGRSTRTLYVSWFWEKGDDATTVPCKDAWAVSCTLHGGGP